MTGAELEPGMTCRYRHTSAMVRLVCTVPEAPELWVAAWLGSGHEMPYAVFRGDWLDPLPGLRPRGETGWHRENFPT